MDEIQVYIKSQDPIEEILHNESSFLHALILFELDDYKIISSNQVQTVSNYIIRTVSKMISSSFRRTDIFEKCGDNRFLVLMRNIPNEEIARSKVYELVQRMKYKVSTDIPEGITISAGFTLSNQRRRHFTVMFNEAEKALGLAKEAGRAQFRQYGALKAQPDTKLSVLIISANRESISAISVAVPYQIDIKAGNDPEDMLKKYDMNNVALIFADSDISDDEDAFWNTVRMSGCDMQKVIALCHEGFMDQYRSAMRAGVLDIFTTPMENTSIKRRMINFLSDRLLTYNG